ncbi:hypothetical protein RU639_005547 [Aspergillus parasiticus]
MTPLDLGTLGNNDSPGGIADTFTGKSDIQVTTSWGVIGRQTPKHGEEALEPTTRSTRAFKLVGTGKGKGNRLPCIYDKRARLHREPTPRSIVGAMTLARRLKWRPKH